MRVGGYCSPLLPIKTREKYSLSVFPNGMASGHSSEGITPLFPKIKSWKSNCDLVDIYRVKKNIDSAQATIIYDPNDHSFQRSATMYAHTRKWIEEGARVYKCMDYYRPLKNEFPHRKVIVIRRPTEISRLAIRRFLINYRVRSVFIMTNYSTLDVTTFESFICPIIREMLHPAFDQD